MSPAGIFPAWASNDRKQILFSPLLPNIVFAGLTTDIPIADPLFLVLPDAKTIAD